jgi:exodeoxyribonuclease V
MRILREPDKSGQASLPGFTGATPPTGPGCLAPEQARPSLSDEQRDAIEALVNGIGQGKGQQTLGGYAGTGKTTSIWELRSRLPHFAVCAYTGKAANMLRRKGLPTASTIHSLIYIPETGLDGKVYFRLRYERELNEVDGFIIDEASMVGRTIHRDLMSFGLPAIFVGDHGQLEPIEPGFNLMQAPDYRLETIHRNSGEIPRFAEWLRLGREARTFRSATGAVTLVDPNDLDDETVLSADQIIVGFNKSRVAINAHVRRLQGRAGPVHVGERVMCLRNNREEGVFNGMQGTVLAVRKTSNRLQIDFETHDGIHRGLNVDPEQFGKEKGPGQDGHRDLHPFDYAYAITAHKAQGDEWDSVLVWEQRCKVWDHRRWAYTSASRAQRRLIWATPGGGR